MNLFSADPGISKGTGVARFHCGVLQGAALIRRPSSIPTDTPEGWDHMAGLCWEWATAGGGTYPGYVALEYPQVYTFGKGKGDPNDLFPIACVAQSLATRGLAVSATIYRYLPREWKGTREKDVNTVDVRRRLTPAEFARVEVPPNTCEHCAAHLPEARCVRYKVGKQWEPCLIHNTYDGIGIGLKALGRFERHRVIPR